MSKKFLMLAFLPLFICALLSFSVSTAEAQVNQEWAHSFILKGYVDIWPKASVIDADGNIYITGYYADAAESDNCVTVKYSSAGNLQWGVIYNGFNNSVDRPNAIAVDSAGNVYVAGYSDDWSKDYYLIIKYNSAGIEQWHRLHNCSGYGNANATAIAVDGSGNIYVTGYSYGGSGTGNDYATIKYNSIGNEEWVLRYNGPGNSEDKAVAIAIDGNGDIYVTGHSIGSGTYYDFATIKYSSAGAEQWVQRISSYGYCNDRAVAIAIDKSGNIFVTGYDQNWSTLDYDYLTVGYTSEGSRFFTAHYDGNDKDYATAMAIDCKGNIYVTGRSGGSNEISCDYATIKYNPQGAQQWVQTYSGPHWWRDIATAIAVDGSGNVYVTGYSMKGNLDSSINYDIVTVKYDSVGTEQWIYPVCGSDTSKNGDDRPISIVVDGAGDIIVTGYRTDKRAGVFSSVFKLNSARVLQWDKDYFGWGYKTCVPASMVIDRFSNVYIAGYSFGNDFDYLVLKYPSIVPVPWCQTYNGPANGPDKASAISVDSVGNFYVTGSSMGFGTNYDFATIKYNSTGSQQWVRRYNGPENSIDNSVAIANDATGNTYVTGNSIGSGTGSDFTTIKYDSTGSEEWVKRYNGTGNSEDNAIAITIEGTGNIYVTGYSIGADSHYDYLTIKYSPAGDELWAKRYNGTVNSNDKPNAIAIDGSGNIYVTGCSDGTGSYSDYLTIKYSPAGDELWVNRYNGAGNSYDIARAIVCDGSGNIYITGSSFSYSTLFDYTTIKYNSSGAVQWVRKYNYYGSFDCNDQATSIAIDESGDIYVLGYSSGWHTNYDYASVKYNSEGDELWVQRYEDTASNNNTIAIAVDKFKNIFITGSKQIIYGSLIETIKYSQLLPPAVPLLKLPENNSTGLPLTPSMQWNTSESADKYNMQIASDPFFINILINQTNITDTMYTITDTVFTTNSLYFWRVNAENGIGTSGWSDTWRFVTYATPQENTQMLISDIDSLQEVGVLNPGNATALKYQLLIALGKINDHKYNAAIRILNAFINTVQSFITENILTPEQGQSLIDQANVLIEQLSGDNIKNTAQIPKEFKLYQNFPNPFNPAANIRYDIPKTSHVRLVVYNTLGQEVTTLVNETLQPGSYKAVWIANNHASGVYFYRLVTAGFTDVKKMVLIK